MYLPTVSVSDAGQCCITTTQMYTVGGDCAKLLFVYVCVCVLACMRVYVCEPLTCLLVSTSALKA